MEENQDALEEKIREKLKSVHDPEIPVNIVDLGLIYELDINDDGEVYIEMTLTSIGCPVADSLVNEVKRTAESVDEVRKVEVDLVWQPPWSPEQVTDEGRQKLRAKGMNI